MTGGGPRCWKLTVQQQQANGSVQLSARAPTQQAPGPGHSPSTTARKGEHPPLTGGFLRLGCLQPAPASRRPPLATGWPNPADILRGLASSAVAPH